MNIDKDMINLTNDSLNDLYNSKKYNKKNKPITLESLHTITTSSNNNNQLLKQEPLKDIKSNKSNSNNKIYSEDILNSNNGNSNILLSPINHDDYHRISNLLFKVTNTNNSNRNSYDENDIDNNSISNDINNYQLQLLNNNNNIKDIMENIIQLYRKLNQIILDNLLHRKELSSDIDIINKQYIQFFR